MPANEFEKQVQERLDHFQLHPSASVWEGVEREIRQKKKRRILLYILLPLLAGGLFFLIYERKDQPGNNTVAAGKEKAGAREGSRQTVGERNGPVEGERETSLANMDEKSSAGTAVPVNGNQQPANTGDAASAAPVSTTNSPGKSRAENPNTAVHHKPGMTVRKQATLPGIAKQNHQKAGVTVKDAAQDAGERQVEPIADLSRKTTNRQDPADRTEVANDHISSIETPVANRNDKVAGNSSAVGSHEEANAVIQPGPTKTKAWRWGPEFATGIAFNSAHSLSLAASNSFDQYYSNVGNVTGVPSPSGQTYPPSSIKPGLSLRAGATIEWKLTKRTSLQSGLYYQYLSNHLRVGSEKDTSLLLQSNASNGFVVRNLTGIYRGAPSNEYSNRYHFLQVPLNLHWQVNRNLPLDASFGIAASYLVNTNALIYDRSLGGIYYKDDNAFNRLQWSANAGLLINLQTKHGQEWRIGPALQFHTTSLLKNERSQYLVTGAVQATWFMGKKKKK